MVFKIGIFPSISVQFLLKKCKKIQKSANFCSFLPSFFAQKQISPIKSSFLLPPTTPFFKISLKNPDFLIFYPFSSLLPSVFCRPSSVVFRPSSILPSPSVSSFRFRSFGFVSDFEFRIFFFDFVPRLSSAGKTVQSRGEVGVAIGDLQFGAERFEFLYG